MAQASTSAAVDPAPPTGSGPVDSAASGHAELLPGALDVNALGLLLKTAQHLSHQAIDLRLDRLGLSLGHWAVLREVARNPGASGNELAVSSFQTRQSLSEAVAKLQGRELLDRRTGPGRRLQHYLTDAGQALLDRCNAEARTATEAGLAGMDPAERAHLQALLGRIVDNFTAVIRPGR